MFSRRPGARFNRGRVAVGEGAGFDPAALVTTLSALNTWHLMQIGDAGVGHATDAGHASAWNDQTINARHWATAGASTEPVSFADTRLGGHYALNSEGGTRRATNAYNPPSTTTPTYRVGVVLVEQWLSGRGVYALGTANRRGLVYSAIPCRANQSGNTITGPNIDMPERKWMIVEEYFEGATTNSYVRIGPTEVTGNNVATIDVSSLGLFASNSGTQPGSASCAFYAEGTVPADRVAVRAALSAYFGSDLRTLKNKVCRYEFRGDSQPRHDVSFDYAGWRKRFFDDIDTTLAYPTKAMGTTANGLWLDTAHTGISNKGIVACSADVDTQLGAGGTMTGAGALDLSILSIGTVDLAIEGVTGATALTRWEALATNILTRETGCFLAGMNLVPYPGNPTNFDDFNAGMGAMLVSLESAFPGRVLTTPIDARGALPGPYDNANYITPGDQHLNATASYGTVGAVVVAALSTIVDTITT